MDQDVDILSHIKQACQHRFYIALPPSNPQRLRTVQRRHPHILKTQETP
jgi:hypothetical protein